MYLIRLFPASLFLCIRIAVLRFLAALGMERMAGVSSFRGDDLGCGFADGLGVLWRFGFVFAEVGEAGEGEGLGLGLHELAAGAGDFFDGLLGECKLLGVDDGAELGEREIVMVAQVECAD